MERIILICKLPENSRKFSLPMTAVLLIIVLFLINCTKPFLTNDQIAVLTYTPSEESQIIFFKQHFKINTSGPCYITTHQLRKIGSNPNAAPNYIYVHDNPMYHVLEYFARLIHHDGSDNRFGLGDLYKSITSNRNIISAGVVRYLPITEHLRKNDYFEEFTKYEYPFLPLGISFSTAQLQSSAQNISCVLECRDVEDVKYAVIHDTIHPLVNSSEGLFRYQFQWPIYKMKSNIPEFNFKNQQPQLYFYSISTSDQPAIRTWLDYGNWYLDFIAFRLESNDDVGNLAAEITSGLVQDKEKLDALFRYCQKNIRYEQVYIEFGEIIPNDIQLVLQRKYGDCKDYSVLIYLLARSVGINCDLALCYRGRGMEFFEEIPVDQFNHMLVHYFDGKTHHWYDGTNRYGIPGITTSDLINQKALILKNNNSELITIAESPFNLLKAEGNFTHQQNKLSGNLKIILSGQYAIDFFFMQNYYNEVKMREVIYDWLRQNINSELIISAIKWEDTDTDFIIQASGEIPDPLLEIKDHLYFIPKRIYNRILTGSNTSLKLKDVDYYPGYNKVDLNIGITNLYPFSNSDASDGFTYQYSFYLPPGPFTDPERSTFIDAFTTVIQKFDEKITISGR